MANADKRSVATDALETLGTIIDETAGRDAIHLAVEPLIAAEDLFPGQSVGIVNGLASSKAEKLLGIVDPFLPHMVKRGSRFWMVIFPRKITSLRHVWSHPDIPETIAPVWTPSPYVPTAVYLTEHDREKEKARQWLENFANSIDRTLKILLEKAKTFVETGEYWYEGEAFDGVYVTAEFWDHYETYTGLSRPDCDDNFFSCSC